MADKTKLLTIEIDVAELAVRMCEVNYGLTRPIPNAQAALDAMDEDVRDAWCRSARAAAQYFQECLARVAPTEDIIHFDDNQRKH